MSKVLVVGDIMVDRYITGTTKRISPEAPVPVLNVVREYDALGGAANVANNLRANHVEVDIMSAIGADENGKKLIGLLSGNGIGTDFIEIDERRPTTVKCRYLAQNNQQIIRVDYESTDALDEKLCLSVKRHLKNIGRYDMVIISDYMKGFLTESVTQSVIEAAEKNKIPVLVDVKDKNIKKYRNAFLLKPNEDELKSITGLNANDEESIFKAAADLCEQANVQYILVTRGAKGMMLVGTKEKYLIPSEAKQVYDVTGAGDTVIAYLAYCLLKKLSIRQAVSMANIAAGVKVSKIGSSAVTEEEVSRHLQNLHLSKTISKEMLTQIKSEGKTIVFTNGCFDVLHAGHIKTLRKAKSFGDVLVVGVNSDASIKRLKGDTRPINCMEDRLQVLESLEFVDYLCVFEEDTPLELIQLLKPDVLVKGSDYQKEKIVGYDVLKEYGGRIELVDLVEGLSTTNIIHKLG